MKKSKFVKELERIIDMVKTGDDGFEYGGNGSLSRIYIE